MYTYLIGMIISILFAGCASICKQKCTDLSKENDIYRKNKMAFYGLNFLSMMPFLLISSIRYNVGTDYKVYTKRFTDILLGNRSKDNVEMGYKLIIKILSFFTDNIQWLFVVTAILFIYLFILFISIYMNIL